MKVWTRFSYLLNSCALAAIVSGCAHAQARVALEVPGLDVPLPPPRTVETYGTEVPLTVEAPVGAPSLGLDDGIRAGASRGPVRPAAPRAETAKPADPPKSDASVAADTSKPLDEPRPQLASSPLQTTPRQREGEVEAAIRTDMERATGILNKVDYQRLGADARTQYTQAKSYIAEAEDALRLKNLPFAKSLTDKAATIAAQLSGR